MEIAFLRHSFNHQPKVGTGSSFLGYGFNESSLQRWHYWFADISANFNGSKDREISMTRFKPKGTIQFRILLSPEGHFLSFPIRDSWK
jgi:hypothetical protein